ncbi:MAG TPA: cbb3-type cytochrome c oxidase subunit II [Polyangiaceae bacterium LLY-WYZ-14_1]|nr:cbb3-type cytochrome c oxidase subunit II [Polyangiaceae bacterium LLY-WYZ-14_1]
MNTVLGVSLLSLVILAFATFNILVQPYQQLKLTQAEPELTPYTKIQGEGREVYVSLGCVYCHSQQPRDPEFAPDQERGWGRPSTPGDYAYDYPHQLGTMRTGPDLFNIGARQSSRSWHLLHLYQPRAVQAGSIMPAFPFLFEVVEEAGEGDVVVDVPAPWGPKNGVVVAKRDAIALTEYLLSLDHTYQSTYIPVGERGGDDSAADSN